MKTSKTSILFLLVSFFSIKSFCQEKHILSHSFALARNEFHNNRIMVKKPYIVDTHIFFKKDSIIFNDGFGSKFEIINKGQFENNGHQFEAFYCKDNEGDFCLIYDNLGADNKIFYIIQYENISYLYYTKND